MSKIKCKTCGKKFEAQRSTATFCTPTCRSNFNQKKQRRKQQLDLLIKEEKRCIRTIEDAQIHLATAQAQVSTYKLQVEQEEEKIKRIEHLLALEDTRLALTKWDDNFNIKPAAIPVNSNAIGDLLELAGKSLAMINAPKTVPLIRKQLEQKKSTLQLLISIPNNKLNECLQSIQQQEELLEESQNQLKEIRFMISQLEEEIGISQKRAKGSSINSESSSLAKPSGVTASELAKMEFKTFTLAGKIGEFLGRMERHKTSIALTGDPGAGKSNFSMALARAFGKHGFKVAYFSLEMGIGQTLKDVVGRYPVPDTVQFFDTATLEDVKEKSSSFDVIIVDSFGKLNCKAIALDELRHQFPDTIFVFILQKTSAGSSRGGVALDYDASMVLDVTINENKDRQVYMKKSRYGTIGWKYLPEKDEVIPYGA